MPTQCVLEKVVATTTTDTDTPEQLNEKLQLHTGCAVGYIIVPNKDILHPIKRLHGCISLPFCVNRYIYFVGKVCMKEFAASLESSTKQIFEWSRQKHGVNCRLQMR